MDQDTNISQFVNYTLADARATPPKVTSHDRDTTRATRLEPAYISSFGTYISVFYHTESSLQGKPSPQDARHVIAIQPRSARPLAW